MGRKIFAGTLMGLSSIFLVLSIVGIFMAWIYNEPLARESTGRLQEIDGIRSTLEDLRDSLAKINELPFVDLNLPGDELLASIITGVDSLDTEIVNVQDLAQRASTFISDTSYLLGGDFNETKQHLEELLKVLDDYDLKVTDWRAQIRSLIESIPGWIDRASIILTIFLLWFGFSQLSLFLHGLSIRRGEDPLEVFKKTQVNL
jgi:hypothetical protein